MEAIQPPFQSLIIRNPYVDDMDAFARLAENCLKAGVTHLTFSEIERSLWEVDDPRDPYLHWSIVHTSLFKLFPPALLADWVPQDYATRARACVANKAKILAESGLRGAVFLYDPMYWPEAVFHHRPDLRGPRVDAPTQCIHPRYAPCVDHPEVLAMYRDAFRQFYELSSGVLDTIILRTNDSATGFCWTQLYNGLNGPTGCKHIASSARIRRFLENGLQGIHRAGGKAKIYLGGGSIAGPDRKGFIDALPQHCGYYAHNKAGGGGERILSGFSTDFSLYPLFGIPNTWEVLDRLALAHERSWPHIVFYTCPSIYGNDWYGDEEPVSIIGHFNRRPAIRLLDKIERAMDAATALYGSAHAADIVESWILIHRAAGILNKSTIGMADLIFYGAMAQRWLTRPLVVYPEKLRDEERAHFLPHLFQASPSHLNPDMLDQSNTRQFDGLRHLAYFNRHFDEACHLYREASARVREVVTQSDESHPALERRLAAFSILECLLHSIRSWVNFHIQLEAFHAKNNGEALAATVTAPKFKAEKIQFTDLIRGEAENCLKLAALLGEHGDLFETAASPQGEGPFMFGPELAANLRRKAAIMFEHLPAVDELTQFKGVTA